MLLKLPGNTWEFANNVKHAMLGMAYGPGRLLLLLPMGPWQCHGSTRHVWPIPEMNPQKANLEVDPQKTTSRILGDTSLGLGRMTMAMRDPGNTPPELRRAREDAANLPPEATAARRATHLKDL